MNNHPIRNNETVDIGTHYERIKPVLKALGESDGAHTLGVHDHHGWYRKRDETDVELIDKGYDRCARPYSLAENANELLGRIDRHYYAVLNYQDTEILRDYEPRRTTEEGIEWRDEKPLPKYSNIEALTLFVDIDLKDEHKERPLAEEKSETFEDVVEGFVGAFGDLVGDNAHVFLLDSVGGAYVLVRPQVTAPIGDKFNGNERGWIFKELASRVRTWISECANEVIQEENAREICKADAIVNVNRQYKAPLSLHKDIDGVVHPLDTEDISYDFVPFNAVDDALIDKTVEWCDEFTAPIESDDPTESLVGALFNDYDGEAWTDRLEAYVKEKQEKRESKKRAAERRAESTDENGNCSEEDGVEDINSEEVNITTHIQVLIDALNNIDVGEVVEEYATDRSEEGKGYDTSDRTGETTFDPSWRESESGESCAVDKAGDKFVDNSCNGGGGAAKAYALGEGIIDHADNDLTGEDWWRAVNRLRSEGYDIPVWIPECGTPKSDDGDEYEETPLWGLRKAAVVLDVLDKDDFVEKKNDDGGTYQGFPDNDAYNRTLYKLDDEGVDHRCARRGDIKIKRITKRKEAARQALSSWISEYETRNGKTPKKGEKTEIARRIFLKYQDFVTVRDEDKLWRYDADEGLWRDDGEEWIDDALDRSLGSEYSMGVVDETVRRVKARTRIERDEFRLPEGMVPVQNGMLDLENGNVRDFESSDYVTDTMTVPRNRNADCPKFRAYLEDVTGSESDRKKLQEYAGYILMRGQMPYHKALFLPGPRNSGKSTFIRIIQSLLPEDVVGASTPNQLTRRFGKACLHRRWLNVSADIPSDMIEDSGTFKMLTGADKVEGEIKHVQERIRFTPTTKHIFSANQLPEVYNADEAFWRRILVIPFPKTVSKKDRVNELARKILEKEGAGVLNWMVEGYERLDDGDSGFTEDRKPEETRKLWYLWSTPVIRFYARCLRDEVGAKADKNAVYAAYKKFCKREMETMPVTETEFGKQLTKFPHIDSGRIKTGGRNKKTVYHNVTLK